MKVLLAAFLLSFLASGALAGPSENRGVCEGRDPSGSAFEREIACTAILSESGLAPSATAMTLVHRAWARTQLNRRADAMADYDRAVSMAPMSHIVLNERALLKLRVGKLDAALADYNAALKIAPGEAYPRYGRGLVYLRKGERARGEADLKAARVADIGVDETFRKIGLHP